MDTTKEIEEVVTEQPLKPEEKELLTEIYERLEIWEQECRPYHDSAKEARMVLRLQDPKQDDPKAKNDKKILQLNTLKSTFNNSISDQMENLPEAKLLPETPDKQIMAEDLQDIVHHVVYDVNHYCTIHKRRAEDFYGTGTAVTQVVWDPSMANGHGDIAIIRWAVESFIWDPKEEDIQNARALFKVSWHPLSWFRQHYPDKAKFISGEDGQYNRVGMPDTQTDRIASDEDRAMLLEYWYRKYDAKKRRYTINVAYAAGGALLEHSKNVFAHGMYPFVIDVYSTIEGMPTGDGMVDEFVPTQRYINRYAHYIDTNLRMASKGRILARRNSGIDRVALMDWSQDLIEGDSIEQGSDWAWLQHAPLNGMVANQIESLKQDLKNDSGVSDAMRGQMPSPYATGKAMQAMQATGGKITTLRADVLNEGFRRIVEQVLWLMSEFYTQDRIFMITGRDGLRREALLVPGNMFPKTAGVIPPPPYTVEIEINRRNPDYIAAQNEMFMQAYTMAAQAQQFFPLSSLFQLLNVDGKDRLMPVIMRNEQTGQMIQQMQQQIEQMQQQMQDMQQENEALRRTSTQMTNALANVNANTGGGGYIQGQQPNKVGGAGLQQGSSQMAVAQGRANLTGNGIPNGML